MKTFTRGSSLWGVGLLLGAVLSVAAVTGCDSIGSDRGNTQPTDPTPGSGTSLRGTMTLTPSSLTYTVKNGGTGGGAAFYFQLTGGKPPYYWGNSWPQMAALTPIDELGHGYYTKAKYVLRNVGYSGDDTIVVRDSTGDAVTALFTKTIEDAAAPTAPSIIPSAVTIACGASVSLTASGGNGSYVWSKSAPDATATLSSLTGATVTLTSVAPCAAIDTEVTLIVTSAGATGTATVTISAPAP